MINLNTSYVKVQPCVIAPLHVALSDLNTSYVKVQH
ncbi:hypothetical protein CPAST_c06470 [Clostridium pasteurianum DSM 525 = ATCC 6013]|uniref:Uncharacterized protein n=1 Tax=Clostridium pasteurianum DSM 525 = ATCC 6013 TaxID=1262449 RepID=A0A0H3J1Z4_CLOPA|nr:hypothetical protein CPAST_c06470 [Clostridium pasteurianum DSM 525 = ATCC 6013]AJA50735.1 hypothetical protein CLPA_c06470 [Clostridium pasteurianum DSM 525 = ATCC 6013]KRU13255.1 hypothetical protein CP6013_02503 [Clostridium pasteurianum DSM 525 = ATCC 6013]